MLQSRRTCPSADPGPDVAVKIVGILGASGAYAVKEFEKDPEISALARTVKL